MPTNKIPAIGEVIPEDTATATQQVSVPAIGEVIPEEPQPQAAPAQLPAIGEVIPETAAQQTEGSMINQALEKIAPLAAKVGESGETVYNKITGTTKEEAEKEAEAERQARQIELPKIPDVPGMQRNPNAPTRIPGFRDRIINRDRIQQMEKEEKEGKLTPAMKENLANMKQYETELSKRWPLPKAPKERNMGIGGFTAYMTDDEIAAIANQYKVPVEVLLNQVALEGGRIESTKEQTEAGEGYGTGQRVADFVGLLDSAGLGIGKWINRATQDPNTRRAIEDMRAIIAQRQGAARMAAEMVLGVGTGLGTSSMLGRAAVTAARTAAGARVAQATGLTAEQLGKATAVALDVGDNLVEAGIAAGTQKEVGESTGKALGEAAAIILPITAVQFLGKPTMQKLGALKTLVTSKKVAAQAAQPKQFELAVERGLPRAQRESSELKAWMESPDAENMPQQAMDLARRLGTNAQDPTEIKKALSIKNKQEPKLIDEAMQDMIVEDEFNKEVATRNLQTTKSSWLGRILDMGSSAPMTAAIYDKKHGTNIMETIDALSADSHIAAAATEGFAEKLNAISEKMRRLKPANMSDGDFLNQVFKAVDSGGLDPKVMSKYPGMEDVVTDFDAFFKDARKYFNAVGQVNVAQLLDKAGNKIGYIPHRFLRGVDRAVALEKKAMQDGIHQKLIADVNVKQDPKVIEIMRRPGGIAEALELLSGKAKLTDDELINEYQRHVGLRGGGDGVRDAALEARTISALQKRGGKMPEWIMDRNPISATMGYISDLARMSFTEGHLRKLEHFKNIAGRRATTGEMFDKDMHSFLDGVTKDLAHGGDPAWTKNKIQRNLKGYQKYYEMKAETTKDPANKSIYKLITGAPEGLIGHVRKTMYGGFLGLQNLKAPIQNLAQPIVSGLPELGNAYGTSVAIRSWLDGVKNTRELYRVKGSKEGSLQQFADIAARSRGYMSSEMGPATEEAMRAELKKQGWFGKGLDKATEASMGLFNMTEKFSRNWVHSMSTKVADDLLGYGSEGAEKSALNFVESMKGSYGKSVKRAMERGDEDGVRTLVSNYIMGRVALNYDKASQAEFTRMLGPIFSSFTRWPTEGIGKLNYALRSGEGIGKAIKEGSKHAPLLTAMFLADSAMNIGAAEDKEKEAASSLARQLVGTRGFAGGWSVPGAIWEPLSMIAGVNKENIGSIYTPPGVELPMTALRGAAGYIGGDEVEKEKALKQLARAADMTLSMTVPLLPGLLEFSERTIPNLVGREEPVKSGAFTRRLQQD